jgi:hypothetical protein
MVYEILYSKFNATIAYPKQVGTKKSTKHAINFTNHKDL